MDAWEILSIVGTISFSLQGALIAMDKAYDLFAVYLFGILTAFGGGAVRNILIDDSDYQLWHQPPLFYIALISITLVVLFPNIFLSSRHLWDNFLDAFGVIAFAIQGAMAAVNMDLPASAIVVSAMITATGGGIIRDVLSQRQPILLGQVIYGLWVFLVGLIIATGWATSNLQLYILFGVFTTLRILSYLKQWKIPSRRLTE